MLVLLERTDAQVLSADNIHTEQMREKKGGQIVEILTTVNEKNIALAML